jgi:hypothetical protein
MPKQTKKQMQNRKTKKSKFRTKIRNKRRIKGGCASVSCANSGSVDHNPPKWYSTIKGGSDMNDDLYNQYTDRSPYSITR